MGMSGVRLSRNDNVALRHRLVWMRSGRPSPSARGRLTRREPHRAPESPLELASSDPRSLHERRGRRDVSGGDAAARVQHVVVPPRRRLPEPPPEGPVEHPGPRGGRGAVEEAIPVPG